MKRFSQRREPLAAKIFAAAILLIRREIPRSSAKRQAVLVKVTNVLARLQRLAQRRESNVRPDTSAWDGDVDLRAWGLLLRARREDLQLTREQLAEQASVAASTIRNIETCRHSPTQSVVSRLLAVASLRLPPAFGGRTVVLDAPVGIRCPACGAEIQ